MAGSYILVQKLSWVWREDNPIRWRGNNQRRLGLSGKTGRMDGCILFRSSLANALTTEFRRKYPKSCPPGLRDGSGTHRCCGGAAHAKQRLSGRNRFSLAHKERAEPPAHPCMQRNRMHWLDLDKCVLAIAAKRKKQEPKHRYCEKDVCRTPSNCYTKMSPHFSQ